MEWLKTQLVKILIVICILETAAIIALLLGKGIQIDRHVENHQHQEQMQSQLSVTIIPDMVDAKGTMTYSKVCIGEKGFKSVEEILCTLPPTQLLFKEISGNCVYVPNFYQLKKK